MMNNNLWLFRVLLIVVAMIPVINKYQRIDFTNLESSTFNDWQTSQLKKKQK